MSTSVIYFCYFHYVHLSICLHNLRGVIKNFVDRCNKINTYEAMLTDFVGKIKQRSTVKAANGKFISFMPSENITFIYRAFQV